MTPWTSREDWLALKFPAEQVAKITCRGLVEVVERQDLLRGARSRHYKRWSQEELAVVQAESVLAAARLTGRTRRAVYHRRRMAKNRPSEPAPHSPIDRLFRAWH